MKFFASSVSSFFALQALLLQCGVAFNPATDRGLCRPGHPCLTSFIWCANPGWDDVDSGCTYPPRAYPMFNRDTPSNSALLLDTANYTVSWKGTDSRYPVMVEWRFQGSGWLNATNTERGVLGRWSQNVTGDTNELTIKFSNMIKEFPNSLSDLNPAEARGLSSEIINMIRISQPEKPLPSNVNQTANTPYTYWSDLSDQFIVLNSWLEKYIDTDREIQAGRITRPWTLGVGIGVGLGVPFLMILAFVGGWKFGGKRATRSKTSLSSSSSPESKKLSSSS